ncbi:MAG: hypothetical protein ACLTCB_05575 [Merdibacter sp.]
MDDFFNYMENIVTPELLIYMAAALAALIILTMLLRGMRKRRLKGMQAGLESQYNEIKGIPLAFKFNKAVALSRVNENMLSKVNECRPTFDAQDALGGGVLLAVAEDMLFVRKNKSVARWRRWRGLTLPEGASVNQVLDEILEQGARAARESMCWEKFRQHPQLFRRTVPPIIRRRISKGEKTRRRNSPCSRSGCSPLNLTRPMNS